MDKAIIEMVQGFGFEVYMRNLEDSWLHYTDGKNIATLTVERFGGVSISSVHKANRTSGTAFQMLPPREWQSLTKADLELGFAVAPGWAIHYIVSVKKYKDMESYLSADNFNAGYHNVREF